MRYLLAGALLLAAAGAGQAESGFIRIGMSREEVRAALGEPRAILCDTSHIWADYGSIDALGGERLLSVYFGPSMTVEEVQTYYYPFAVRPPWLERVWNACGPWERRP